MISYPVDVETSTFTVIKDGQAPIRGKRWPRLDGMQIQDLAGDISILEEVFAADPVFDPATHKLDAGAWTDDIPNETATFARSAVALTQGELDEAADTADREAKRTLVANAIPTLRTWSTQAGGVTVTSGNAVSVLQQVVDNLAVFYDRFADLLEAQRIDQ